MIEFAWAIVHPDGHVHLSTRWEQSAEGAWAAFEALPELVRLVESGAWTRERAVAAGYRALRLRLTEAGPA